MWFQVVLSFLFVLQISSLSVLTDDKSSRRKTADTPWRSENTEPNILRQLINQETIIRLSLDRKVHDIVAEMKTYIETNNKELQEAKQEILALKNELSSLKNETSLFQTDALKIHEKMQLNFQEIMDMKFQAAEENLTQIKNKQDQYMKLNSKQHQNAWTEILALKGEVKSVKNETDVFQTDIFNMQDKTQANFQEIMDMKFQAVEENFTKILNNQEQYESNVTELFETFKENSTHAVADIRRDVRSLSSSLVDLKSRTIKMNVTIPDVMHKIITEYSADWNSSVTKINKTFDDAWSKMDKDHSNQLMVLSDGIKTSIRTIQTDVDQSKKARLKLSSDISSAVSSLEGFRKELSSLTRTVQATSVGFTVGITSLSSSWEGGILKFPHVITNTGYVYSTYTGKFTAPRDGTYVFFVTIVSYEKNYISLIIVHDASDKVKTWSTGDTKDQTGTNMVVLKLIKGNSVWVRRASGKAYSAASAPYATFSGFLL